LVLTFILEVLEIIKSNVLECVSIDLSERLSRYFVLINILLTLKSNSEDTWIIFSRVVGLESLASHLLRLYYTHKVWCGGTDEGLVECGKTQK